MVKVAVPPLHETGVVTTAEVIDMRSGSVTLIVPVTGPQLLASVTLHEKLVPATIPVNTPFDFVTPFKV